MHPVIWFAPIGLVLLALLPFPYGYYVFLRLVICLSAGFIAYRTWSISPIWGAVFVGLALVYNPLIRVHLTREIWQPINIATAAAYFFHWLRVRRYVDR